MVKERKSRFYILAIVAAVVIIESIAYFFFFSKSKTISGLPIINVNLSPLSPVSTGIIIGQWTLVILLIVIAFLREKFRLKKQLEQVKTDQSQKFKKKISETDLDVLYGLLKKEKTIRLTVIATTFNITKDTALEWCKVLESGKLAEIRYPTFGDPQIVLLKKIDHVKKEEKTDKNKGYQKEGET